MLKIAMHNLKQILIAIDQLGNAVVCAIIFPKEKVWADETLSAHSWRWHLKGYPWPRRIVDTLLFFDKNHCEGSFQSERDGRQLPPECRPNK